MRISDWSSDVCSSDLSLANYLQPRAQGSAFSDFYLRFFAHHLRAIAKPGGLFEDTTVTRLPWRGQVRRVRMVVYRRTSAAQPSRRGQPPEQALTPICDRLAGGQSGRATGRERVGEYVLLSGGGGNVKKKSCLQSRTVIDLTLLMK